MRATAPCCNNHNQTNKQEANTTLVEQNSAGFGKSPFPKAVFLQKLKYMECENNYIYIYLYLFIKIKKNIPVFHSNFIYNMFTITF